MKGEKGIKILAPAPYKEQEERENIDPATQKPVIGADGTVSYTPLDVYKRQAIHQQEQTQQKRREVER